MVRAKFRCISIREESGTVYAGDGTWKEGKVYAVTLTAVHEPDPEKNAENAKFWHATPSGNITLSVIKEEVAKTFVVNEYYYVDFSQV